MLYGRDVSKLTARLCDCLWISGAPFSAHVQIPGKSDDHGTQPPNRMQLWLDGS